MRDSRCGVARARLGVIDLPAHAADEHVDGADAEPVYVKVLALELRLGEARLVGVDLEEELLNLDQLLPPRRLRLEHALNLISRGGEFLPGVFCRPARRSEWDGKLARGGAEGESRCATRLDGSDESDDGGQHGSSDVRRRCIARG